MRIVQPSVGRRRPRAVVAVLLCVSLLALTACTTGPVPGFDVLGNDAVPAGARSTPESAATVAPAPTVSPTPAGLATPVVTSTPTPMPTPPPAPPPLCTETTMSVWAHPDDDILFLQPSIADDITARRCVRTVFLTSGDAGRGSDYWLGREAGIMRAYDVMRGVSSLWVERVLPLTTGAQVSEWQPADDPRLAVLFFHLPDGNLYGEGYPSTGEVSLAKLAADKILAIASVGNAYQLSWGQIVDSLSELIRLYLPAKYHTHVPGGALKWAKGDHADHAITGILGRQAWQAAGLPEQEVDYAIGYQISDAPANLDGDVLSRKIAAFRAYAAGDPVVAGCRDDATCLAMPRFGQWLQRQYTKTEAELWQ